MRRRISIRGSVRPSVGPSVRRSVRPYVPCYFQSWKERILGASCAVYPALFFFDKWKNLVVEEDHKGASHNGLHDIYNAIQKQGQTDMTKTYMRKTDGPTFLLSYLYWGVTLKNIFFLLILSDDRILRINGEDVSDSPRDRVIEAIRACDERILLTVCQPVNLKRVVNGGGGGGGSPSNQSATNVTPNGTGTNQKSSFMTEVRRSSRFKSRGRPLRSHCVHRVRCEET